MSIILDSLIHRVLDLGVNITKDSNYSIIPTNNASGDFLVITPKGGATTTVKCNFYVPPASGVFIQQKSSLSGSQFPTPVISTSHRIILFGTELSTDLNYSIVIVNKTNLDTGALTDTIIITNKAKTLNISTDAGGSKIPPGTGLNLFFA